MSATARIRAGGPSWVVQTEVISLAIELLVMGGGEVGEVLEAVYTREDRVRVGGVAFHLGQLVGGELSRLVEDQVGDAELADVVHERGSADVADFSRE